MDPIGNNTYVPLRELAKARMYLIYGLGAQCADVINLIVMWLTQLKKVSCYLQGNVVIVCTYDRVEMQYEGYKPITFPLKSMNVGRAWNTWLEPVAAVYDDHRAFSVVTYPEVTLAPMRSGVFPASKIKPIRSCQEPDIISYALTPNHMIAIARRAILTLAIRRDDLRGEVESKSESGWVRTETPGPVLEAHVCLSLIAIRTVNGWFEIIRRAATGRVELSIKNCPQGMVHPVSRSLENKINMLSADIRHDLIGVVSSVKSHTMFVMRDGIHLWRGNTLYSVRPFY